LERREAGISDEVDMAALLPHIDNGDADRLYKLMHGKKIDDRQKQELVMYASNR